MVLLLTSDLASAGVKRSGMPFQKPSPVTQGGIGRAATALPATHAPRGARQSGAPLHHTAALPHAVPAATHGAKHLAAASCMLAASLLLQLPAALPSAAAEALGPDMRAQAAAAAGGAAGTSAQGGAGSSRAEKAAALQTVYFGNGCFWGRQKDFVDVEMKALGRRPEELTALVGYAAGARAGPDGRVCYVYSADPRTHYDELGHAEVVALGVSTEPGAAEQEVRLFAQRYFEQFRRLSSGKMQRSDPQDRGAAYRNVIGIPGGVQSPFYLIIRDANKYGMELREGRGNSMERGRPTEDDELNVVWVVDSEQLPFYRAERYHQFHNGLGKKFSKDYVVDLRNEVARTGRINPTGCLELPF